MSGFFKKSGSEDETFFNSNEDPIPISELALTLNDIYFLQDLVSNYFLEAPNPTAKRYAKELGTGLFQIWSYWNKRSPDPSRFTLKIKR